MKMSWCLTLKNRIRPKWENTETGEVIELRLLDNCLQSLAKQRTQDETWEICIADWGSDDVECVESHVSNLLSGTGVSLSIRDLGSEAKFSRGKGLNEAFALSKYDNIFFLDADMLFESRDVIDDTLEVLERGNAYFPMCSKFNNIDHTSRTTGIHENAMGTGMMAIRRELFLKKPDKWLGRTQWGVEDNNMYNFYSKLEKAERTNPSGYFHQWHPPAHDKPRRYVRDKSEPVYRQVS